MYKKPPSKRQLKVAENLRQLLSGIFMEGDIYVLGTKNNLNITITEISVSPDLSNATIYFLPLCVDDKGKNDEFINNLERTLLEITPFLKKKIAMSLSLRKIPELKFQIDNQLHKAFELDGIIKSLEIKDN